MRIVFLRLSYLNTWSLVGGAVSEVVELFGGKALSEDYDTGCELGEVISSPLFIFFECLW